MKTQTVECSEPEAQVLNTITIICLIQHEYALLGEFYVKYKGWDLPVVPSVGNHISVIITFLSNQPDVALPLAFLIKLQRNEMCMYCDREDTEKRAVNFAWNY